MVDNLVMDKSNLVSESEISSYLQSRRVIFLYEYDVLLSPSFGIRKTILK